MKKLLRRAFTYMVVLSIGISGLTYLVFDVAQLQFKIDAAEHITESARLQTIQMPAAEFSRLREKDEIWVGNELYDVRGYIVINDKVFLSVLHDEHEENLVKIIADSFEPAGKFAPGYSVHLSKHRVQLPDGGKVFTPRYVMAPVFYSISHTHVPYFAGYSCSSPTSVIKPPPRSV